MLAALALAIEIALAAVSIVCVLSIRRNYLATKNAAERARQAANKATHYANEATRHADRAVRARDEMRRLAR